MTAKPRSEPQRGYTLVPVLAMAAATLAGALYVWAAPRDDRTLREQRTSAALALARDTLIGRAAGDDTRPGSLPCPDVDNDGDADGVAGNCTAYLGRLPWRTLGLGEIRDGWGERLWYALTNAYRDNAAGGALNSDTPGAYTVRDAAGAVLASQAPAVIIAPGPPLGQQSRGPTSLASVPMYLESENANGDAVYVMRPADATFNDRVAFIAREDLFRPVVARVAKEARQALERYRAANGYYPAANPYAAAGPSYYCNPATHSGRIPLTIHGGTPATGCTSHAPWNAASPEFPAWFFDNAWHLLTHYAVSTACADPDPAARPACASGAGSDLAIAGISTAARYVLIVSGPARSGQNRPCANPADCLDDGANADGDTRYARPVAWPASNDSMAAACSEAASCTGLP